MSEIKIDKAKAAINLHAELVKRFIEIMGMNVYEPDYARITVDGDTATITWVAGDSYDGYYVEDESIPLDILLLCDEDRAAWKAEQKVAAELERQREEARCARALEERERTLLAALKAKYEEGQA